MSNGTKTYKFKPALLKRKQSYFVTENQIELANKDGSDTIVRFDSITSLRYADTNAREYKFRRLDIDYGDDEQMRINFTTTISANVHNDKDLAQYYKLIHAIGNQIDKTGNNLTVTIGESSRINWIYFTIGALTLLGAIGILLGAYLSGVSDKKLMNALFPMIVMAGFGAYICFMARPWASRPEIDMAKFKLLIEKLQQGS